MKYKSLGNTGLYVSELTLGAMTFDKEGGSFSGMIGATGQELATKMVNMSLDARLMKLQERHATLEQQIAETAQHPSADSLELRDLKRQKLQVKEEIERIRSEPTLH